MKWLAASSSELKQVSALTLTGLSLVFDWPFWIQLPLGLVTIISSIGLISKHREQKSD